MENITMMELKEKGLIINGSKVTYNGKPCVLDFYADWCAPCKPQLLVLNELSNEHKEVNFFKVNVEDEYELAELLHIKNLPTVYILNKEIKTFSGFTQKNRIKEVLNNTIKIS